MAAGHVTPAAVASARRSATGFEPRQAVVRFGHLVSREARASLVAALGARVRRHVVLLDDTLVLELPVRERVTDAVARLDRSSLVRWAQPNYIFHATSTTPNDPDFAQQWALQNTGQTISGQTGQAGDDIEATEAWDYARGSSSTIAAVIDSGIAETHPDIAPNLYHNPGESGSGRETNGIDDDGNGLADDVTGYDFVNDAGGRPKDYFGHGTHVASTALAQGNDGVGVTGVAWHGQIMDLRVLDQYGYGDGLDIASAIAYAAKMGARVANLSLGSPYYDHAIDDAVSENPGLLLVAAAGNDASDDDAAPTYPCALPYANIVCVAATDAKDQLAPWSNYGPTSVDLAAPGVGILADQPYIQPVYQEDFEHGLPSGWATPMYGMDAWGLTTEYASSGTHGFSDSPSGPYRVGEVADAGTPIFDMQYLYGCRMDLRLWLDLADDYDEFSVATDPDTGHSDVWNFDYHSNTTAARLSFDLSDLGGPGSAADRVAFGLGDENTKTADGATIDDLWLRCLDPSKAARATDNAIESGTSMAAPQVTGAAVLAFGARPDATAAQVKSAILAGVDARSTLSGKVASGGRLDLLGMLQALGVTQPIPPEPPSGAPQPTDPTSTAAPTPPASDPSSSPALAPADTGSPTPPLAPGTTPQDIQQPAQAVQGSGVPGKGAPRLRPLGRGLRIDRREGRHALLIERVQLSLPPSVAVTARCRGNGCPFRSRRLSHQRVRHGRRAVTLRGLSGVTLRYGQTLTLLLRRGARRDRIVIPVRSPLIARSFCGLAGARSSVCAR